MSKILRTQDKSGLVDTEFRYYVVDEDLLYNFSFLQVTRFNTNCTRSIASVFGKTEALDKIAFASCRGLFLLVKCLF